MQTWQYLTIAALALTLVGVHFAMTPKTMLEAKPSTVPTMFDYMGCMGGCKKICDGPDSLCRQASTKFQTCYAATSACQDWTNKQAQLQSSDPIDDTYYTCYDTCKPDMSFSAGYWTIYSCNVGCAGEKVANQAVSKKISTNNQVYNQVTATNTTFFDYQQCQLKYPIICNDDAACNQASYLYTTCYYGDKVCKAWDDIQAQLQSDSPMPDEFFGCDKDCRPSQTTSSKYYGLYMSRVGCGGIKA